MSSHFCLKWNNHQSTLVAVMKQLLSDERLTDVTLSTEGNVVSAHRVVLSACSPYFEKLFSVCGDKHCIVVLKDISFENLKSLLEFMYHGEVNVAHDQLPSLIKTAESLCVKGLADSGTPKSNYQKTSETKLRLRESEYNSPIAVEGKVQEGTASKRRRREKPFLIGVDDQPVLSSVNENVDEILPGKHENEPAEVEENCEKKESKLPVMDNADIKKEDDVLIDDGKSYTSNSVELEFNQSDQNAWHDSNQETTSPYSCDNSAEGPGWSGTIDPELIYSCDSISEDVKQAVPGTHSSQFSTSENSIEGFYEEPFEEEGLPVTRFVCHTCGRRYKRRVLVIRHIRYECGNKRKFTCSICFRSFRHNFHLQRHHRYVHTTEFNVSHLAPFVNQTSPENELPCSTSPSNWPDTGRSTVDN